MSPHYSNNCEYMIDVGLWGIPKCRFPFDGISINREIEKWLLLIMVKNELCEILL